MRERESSSQRVTSPLAYGTAGAVTPSRNTRFSMRWKPWNSEVEMLTPSAWPSPESYESAPQPPPHTMPLVRACYA